MDFFRRRIVQASEYRDRRNVEPKLRRVVWSESLSPHVKVATIVIPVQEFDTPALQEYGDNLSFNPWHSLPEHRPLGSINRGRRVFYETMSKFRHE